jgi:hypothetical protein
MLPSLRPLLLHYWRFVLSPERATAYRLNIILRHKAVPADGKI